MWGGDGAGSGVTSRTCTGTHDSLHDHWVRRSPSRRSRLPILTNFTHRLGKRISDNMEEAIYIDRPGPAVPDTCRGINLVHACRVF